MPFQKGQSGNPAGKPKGALRKATAKREAEIRASGLAPLDWMLRVLRDESEAPARRDDMAKAAAPYVHPKLNAVTHKGDEDHPVVLRWALGAAEATPDPSKK
jgi:hypothetical protein